MPRRHRIFQFLAAALVSGSILFGSAAAAAAATPAPFGSTALYHWLASTAAKALQASAGDDDLSAGSLLVANSGARRGLDQLEDLVPSWLAEVDARLSVTPELDARYGLSANRLIFRDDRRDLRIAAFGSVDVDQGGRRSGEVGVSAATPLASELFQVDVAGGLQQEWLRERERYTSRVEVAWWRARFKGSMFNEQTMGEEVGALHEQRLLDGYEVDLSTAVPYATWARFGARHSHLAPTSHGAEPHDSANVSLRLTPLSGLQIETGTGSSTGSERQWFARLQYKLTLGGR
jgi:hypothetical protein